MNYDITFCNPFKGCDKKETCERWIENLRKKWINEDDLKILKSRVSVSDFSTDNNGKKVKILLRPTEGIPTIRAPCKVIQYLGKTNNTSQNGIVRIFLEDKKPLRMLFPVGYYGKLVVLIRDQAIPLTTQTATESSQ